MNIARNGEDFVCKNEEINGFKFNDFAELIPEELIEKASKFSTAQLCDGMKEVGVVREGCADAEIMPVSSNMKLIGTAYTVHTSEGNNFPIHMALYDPRLRPGYVLVVAGEAATERCYLGDLIVSTAKAVGLSGIIVDGYVRDKEGCQTLGFPVFSRGFMPRGPGKTVEGEINGTVVFAGVTVHPGDLVVGDADGVTFVPRDQIEEVLAAAQKKDDYEIKRRRDIAEHERRRINGDSLNELAPSWVLEMQKSNER